MSNPIKIAKILLPLPFAQGFSYFVPDFMEVEIGDIVKVPFQSREIFGVVISLAGHQENTIDVKKIKTIISKDSLTLNSQLLEFIKWVANYNLVPVGLILKLTISILNSAKEPKRKSNPQEGGKSSQITLNPLDKDQQVAANFLFKKIDENKYCTILLDGVTGSGKTEVYFSAIAKILSHKSNSGQILILLPEVALTSQLSNRFNDQFGFQPDLWHNKISPGKKLKLFRKISDGTCSVLIGARSALFLPFKNLKLIIVDEEHDQSFKQEDVVNYNGRDMAVIRAKFEEIPLILSSATPSIETYLNAKNGKYQLVKLKERFKQENPTCVSLVDMREKKPAKGQFLSDILKQELKDHLENKKQSLLFINRRGYAPLTLCNACGHKISCRNCSSYVTFHQKINRLTCHHCGNSHQIPNTCPECKEKDCLVSCGAGAERIFEEIKYFLPEARVALLTSDTIKNINDAENIIKQILNHEIDIIIGTQMIAKGHHFPFLALVGIIDGDGSFLGGDLRTMERSYQLLTQVIGRAGRQHYQGKVILQTYNPQNSIFEKIINSKRDEFLEIEIQNRKMMNFPPFAKMAAIIVSSVFEKNTVDFAKLILRQFPTGKEIEIFGPAPMPIARIKNCYHYRLNIKTDKNINIQKLISASLSQIKIPSNIRVKIDIDPS